MEKKATNEMKKNYKYFKNPLLLEEIVFKWDPDFKDKGVKKFAMKRADIMDVERLVETCYEYASYGKLKFVDADGYDFTDKSDSKTATVKRSKGKKKLNGMGYYMENKLRVSNLIGKVGDIRLVVANPIANKVDYFFIPHNEIENVTNVSGKNNSNTKTDRVINASYNQEKDDYNSLEPYRVASFEELANM